MPTVDSLLAQLWQQHQNGNVKGAEAGYRELLKKVPQNANAHVYLGIALFDLRRFAEAVDCYRAALKIQPLFPVAWNNLGNALRMLNQIDAADAAFQKALDQRPNYANAFKNRGTLWVWTGEIERGLKWYQDALKIAPEDVELHRNLGVIYLLQGRFDEGWQEYRWRWRMPHTPRPAIQCPLWEGQSLANKSIFVYPEQGLGDAIQFVRMIDVLRQQGARVTLGCEPRLVPLFSSLANVENIVPLGGQFQPVDYHASLVDVTDYTWQGAHSISGEPYLNVPANLIEFWRKQLGVIPGRRIGLCWQGNPSHHADVYRSIPLQAFRSLADVPGITFISLQHGHGSEQIQQCDFGHRIVRLPPNLDANGAFLDTAAIMKNLDCVDHYRFFRRSPRRCTRR
jgi:Flp pilus assembly protein TadD